ncbi:MAG: hypothetical protein U0165_08880 [Polyangiaceae bacterium]
MPILSGTGVSANRRITSTAALTAYSVSPVGLTQANAATCHPAPSIA